MEQMCIDPLEKVSILCFDVWFSQLKSAFAGDDLIVPNREKKEPKVVVVEPPVVQKKENLVVKVKKSVSKKQWTLDEEAMKKLMIFSFSFINRARWRRNLGKLFLKVSRVALNSM